MAGDNNRNTHQNGKRQPGSGVGASDPVNSYKAAREYVWAALRGTDMNMAARAVLLLMVSQWHPKRGWAKSQRTLARDLRISHDTAERAFQELEALGLIYTVEPGKGRKAAVYDFGPNRHEVIYAPEGETGNEPQGETPASAGSLHPDHRGATQYGLRPDHRGTKPPLRPDHQGNNGITGQNRPDFCATDAPGNAADVSPPYEPGADPWQGWEPDL